MCIKKTYERWDEECTHDPRQYEIDGEGNAFCQACEMEKIEEDEL